VTRAVLFDLYGTLVDPGGSVVTDLTRLAEFLLSAETAPLR
jgi:hypothetical protein